MMPRQLARSNRRHDRRSEPRPTIELMPAISIHDLRHSIPRYHGQVNEPNVELKYPGIARLRLFADHIEITGRNGHVQYFRIVRIRTGLGAPRAILVCSCGYGAIRLFGHYGNYACRHCHKAIYASQKYNQIGRKRLAASKLRLLQLGGWPDVHEPLPPKPKWTRHRTYQRIRNEIQVLEATANSRRFRKPIPTQLFAYHLG
jgi:hypothetical protein